MSHKAMVLSTSPHPFGTLNPFPVGAENENIKKKMKIHVEMWQQKKKKKSKGSARWRSANIKLTHIKNWEMQLS